MVVEARCASPGRSVSVLGRPAVGRRSLRTLRHSGRSLDEHAKALTTATLRRVSSETPGRRVEKGPSEYGNGLAAKDYPVPGYPDMNDAAA